MNPRHRSPDHDDCGPVSGDRLRSTTSGSGGGSPIESRPEGKTPPTRAPSAAAANPEPRPEASRPPPPRGRADAPPRTPSSWLSRVTVRGVLLTLGLVVIAVLAFARTPARIRATVHTTAVALRLAPGRGKLESPPRFAVLDFASDSLRVHYTGASDSPGPLERVTFHGPGMRLSVPAFADSLLNIELTSPGTDHTPTTVLLDAIGTSRGTPAQWAVAFDAGTHSARYEYPGDGSHETVIRSHAPWSATVQAPTSSRLTLEGALEDSLALRLMSVNSLVFNSAPAPGEAFEESAIEGGEIWLLDQEKRIELSPGDNLVIAGARGIARRVSVTQTILIDVDILATTLKIDGRDCRPTYLEFLAQNERAKLLACALLYLFGLIWERIWHVPRKALTGE